MAKPRQLPAVRAALGNTHLRRGLVAYLASVVTEWALWAGLLVYAYNRGGQTIAGLVSIGLLIPGVLIAPLTGAAADGPRPNRVLTMVYIVQTVSLSIATAAAFAEAPLVTVVVPAAVALSAISFIRPCFAVVVPGLVTSAAELTAANLLIGYCDNSSILAGPLIASGLIALQGPPTVLAACASLALLGTAATLPLMRLDPDQLPAAALRDRMSRTATLIEGLRSLAQRRGALQLLAVLGGQYVLIGALDLIYVVLATEEFAMSSSGPGILAASFGVGAVLGGLASTLLVGRKRLAPLMLISLLAITSALAIVFSVPKLPVALVLFAVAGLGRAVLDVTGRMLMQRTAPQEALASIFATLESLALLECALGSVAALVAIAVSGVRAAVIVVAGVLGAMLVLTAKRLIEVDASADVPVVAIRLLRRIPIFASLPGPALEGVARTARPIHVAAGEPIICEGEPGDSYYAIITGQVDVTLRGRHTRTMSRGQGFGEVALLADVARTATVTANTDVELLRIERAPFLTAVTGHDASKQAAWSVARIWDPRFNPEAVSDQ